MQQLEERNTYTPTDIPHVSGNFETPIISKYLNGVSNCDLALKREETLSVSGLKTSSNNSDAALIATEHAKQNTSVSAVYVLNMRGKPLMPTTPGKAQNLLKEDKAKVVKRTPFTIQLKYATGEVKQEITLGVDSGYENIGISAITAKKEVYSAEVKLRTDMVKLNSERRQYRRARRNRKTWYRPPRFLNRKKPEGWLAPSIQHKLDSHLKLIYKVKQLLPITKIIIEVAAFDIQKIKNTAPRFILGFQRFDKVLWNNIECFVFGRRKTGYFELRKLDRTKVHASAKAKELTLLETANTLLISYLKQGTLLHTFKSVVSATPAPHGVL